MRSKFKGLMGGFTLVEIMIVVAIIALLASLAIPGFLRARKRAQATRIKNDLRLIDNAVDLYAIESNKAAGAQVPVAEWTKYIKQGTALYRGGNDLLGHSYGPQNVDQLPQLPYASWTALSDVANSQFWEPYVPAQCQGQCP